MDSIEIKDLFQILIFMILPVLTGYIAYRRGRSSILWGLLTFFTCGVGAVIIFILPRRLKICDSDMKMDDNTRRLLQNDMERAQIESMDRTYYNNQDNSYFN